ncbi:MAG TPA: hypothetical protein VF041_09420 [Gemmatimonadaceae bacterium]
MSAGDAVERVPRVHARTVARYGAIAGIIGLVPLAIGVGSEPRRALAAYLFAYATVLTVVLGALIQLMMGHVSAARWFTVLRRLTLGATGALPALVILAIPLLAGVRILYPWATPSALPGAMRALIARKHGWLDVGFFIARGVLYLVLWLAVSAPIRHWSLRQDRADGEEAVMLARRLRRASAVGLIVVGLALTFAAFDWLMSLEPAWYSTIYGVYVFAGGYLAALALIAVVAWAESRRGGSLDWAVTPEHFGALGKLLLTFVIFWGYIGFSQYLIIWIGDVPGDVSWYVARAHGSWGALALVVAAGQFALPFLLLLPRELKRRPGFLAALGAWLLVMHVLDVYWLVLPALHPDGIHPSWLDAGALLMVTGFATATAAWRAAGEPALPLGDPYVEASVRYVEP